MLNNIEYMRLWLLKLLENLGWEDVINVMIVVYGERGGKYVCIVFENMLFSLDEDMFNKIVDVIEYIG